VTEGFKEVLTDYKLGYEKHINYLKQTNREQYALMLSIHGTDSSEKIRNKNSTKHSEDDKKFQKELQADVLEDGKKFLQKSLKEKDEHLKSALKEERAYLGDALREKDEYLETALREKDEYLETALREKDKVISDMENSLAFRTMRKLDKLLGRKHKKK
jgi:hypothetical protein